MVHLRYHPYVPDKTYIYFLDILLKAPKIKVKFKSDQSRRSTKESLKNRIPRNKTDIFDVINIETDLRNKIQNASKPFDCYIIKINTRMESQPLTINKSPLSISSFKLKVQVMIG